MQQTRKLIVHIQIHMSDDDDTESYEQPQPLAIKVLLLSSK
jgi:hypothetical protein